MVIFPMIVENVVVVANLSLEEAGVLHATLDGKDLIIN